MKRILHTTCLLAALTATVPAWAQSRVNLGTQVNGTLPVANGGTGGTTATGTGAVVRATSPTISGATISGGTVVISSGATGSINNMIIGNTTTQNVTGTTLRGNVAVQTAGYFQGTSPTNVTATTYTTLGSDNFINFNITANATLTLPTATAGRMLWLRNTAAFAVNSATANVMPMGSTTAGTAILPAIAGKWALLIANGGNWTIMAAN